MEQKLTGTLGQVREVLHGERHGGREVVLDGGIGRERHRSAEALGSPAGGWSCPA